MASFRRFRHLESAELNRLIKLIFDEAVALGGKDPLQLRVCGIVAAELRFELWARSREPIEPQEQLGPSLNGGVLDYQLPVH